MAHQLLIRGGGFVHSTTAQLEDRDSHLIVAFGVLLFVVSHVVGECSRVRLVGKSVSVIFGKLLQSVPLLRLLKSPFHGGIAFLSQEFAHHRVAGDHEILHDSVGRTFLAGLKAHGVSVFRHDSSFRSVHFQIVGLALVDPVGGLLLQVQVFQQTLALGLHSR